MEDSDKARQALAAQNERQERAEREAEWARLAEKASPGPWEHCEDADYLHDGTPRAWRYIAEPDGTRVADMDWERRPDAAFIAAARTAVPELLDRIHCLEARQPIVCAVCRGRGKWLPPEKSHGWAERCPSCNGSGAVWRED